MSLRFIIGRSGTGKTSFCFKEIASLISNNNKIYIITPEQFSFTAEQNLMNAVKSKAVINAEVLTFERMAYRVLNEIGGLLKTNLSECGRTMMLYNILDETIYTGHDFLIGLLVSTVLYVFALRNYKNLIYEYLMGNIEFTPSTR